MKSIILVLVCLAPDCVSCEERAEISRPFEVTFSISDTQYAYLSLDEYFFQCRVDVPVEHSVRPNQEVTLREYQFWKLPLPSS